MLGVKPDPKMWARMNLAALAGGESVNAGVLVVTMVGALTNILIEIGVCSTMEQARAHLAAILLSPDDREGAGSLMPLLHAELTRISDGKWLT